MDLKPSDGKTRIKNQNFPESCMSLLHLHTTKTKGFKPWPARLFGPIWRYLELFRSI